MASSLNASGSQIQPITLYSVFSDHLVGVTDSSQSLAERVWHAVALIFFPIMIPIETAIRYFMQPLPERVAPLSFYQDLPGAQRVPLPQEVSSSVPVVPVEVPKPPLPSTEAEAIIYIQRGGELKNLSDDLRGNRNVVLAAVRKHPPAIAAAHPRFRNDADVMLEVGPGYWGTTSNLLNAYLSTELKDNPEFILRLCERYIRDADRIIREVATHRVSRDIEFNLEAVIQGYVDFDTVRLRFYPDSMFFRKFMLDAVTKKPALFNEICQGVSTLHWKSSGLDKEFVLELLGRNGLVLEHIPIEDRTQEVVCAAVIQNREAMKWVPANFIAAAATDPALLPLLDPSDERITPDWCLAAVKANPLLLGAVPAAIQEGVTTSSGENIIDTALMLNPNAFIFINPRSSFTARRLESMIANHTALEKRASLNKALSCLTELVLSSQWFSPETELDHEFVRVLASYYHRRQLTLFALQKCNSFDLSMASEDLKKDHKVVIIAMRYKGLDQIQYASKEIRDFIEKPY